MAVRKWAAGAISAAAVVAGFAAAVPAANAETGRGCDSTDFCVWKDEEYSGSTYNDDAANAWWAGASDPSNRVWDSDSSWRSRYLSLYWVCVYDLKNFGGGGMVWVKKGQSIPAVASGMHANRGASHKGRNQNQTCG